MHKKLEAELVSLAHSILQMKNKEDIYALHKKAHDIYEKLSVLKFVEDYILTTPNLDETKEEVLFKMEEVMGQDEKKEQVLVIENQEDVVKVEEIEELEEKIEKETLETAQTESLIEEENEMIKDDAKEIPSLQISLEEEFKDAISADVATELFEKATKENHVIEDQEIDEEIAENKQQTLNDTLQIDNLQVRLNDRIAFVKHLFEGSQEDFNRVLSQLNSFKSEKEAKNFVSKMIKPEYDWSTKETYEERLMDIIERRFA